MATDTANLKHWRFTIDFEDIAWAHFNQAGQSQNTLGRETTEELRAIIDRVEEAAHNEKVRGLIVISDKETSFIAGADIKEFDNLTTEAEVKDIVTQVTTLFDRIEKLPVPVIAAISGFCLGGGLEFSLACHYRIATRENGTRIGLPEVKLGIIPGLNGTARWIRQTGPLNAMPNMLQGKMLRASQAKAIGLVDQLVPTRHELRWAARKAVVQKRNSKPAGGIVASVLELQPARKYLAQQMRKETAAKVREEHYPAPFRLIDLFEAHGGDFEAMRKAETELFAPLMISEQSRSLRRVFRLTEMLKAEAPKGGAKPQRVHVIGAGTMGADIAMACVAQGMEVSIQDTTQEAVDKARDRAKAFFKKRLKGAGEAAKAQARLFGDVEGAHVPRADVVIEAIYENLEAKQKLFASLEPRLKPGALLATNTSSLPIEQIASVLKDPTRLIGLHFFNPATVLPLVEVVHGPQSREEEVRKGAVFVTSIDKYPLLTKSVPGFLVNRVLAPYMFGAMEKLKAGIAKEKIDAAAEKFGMPMGPIELADVVGLDVSVSVAKVLQLQAPQDHPLARLVAQNKLGKKTGEGFYKWVDGKPVKAQSEYDQKEIEALGRTLIKPLIDECEKALAEGVVASADHVDAGVIFGTGFAPFRGGPLYYRASLASKEAAPPENPHIHAAE